LHKIGFKTDDLCSFCKAEPETLYHLFYECSHVRNFWSEFQGYWHQISDQQVYLSLQDVLQCIWNINQTMPITKLTELLHNNWKTIHVGLQKM